MIYETYTPTHAELRRYLMARPQPVPRVRQTPPYWDTYWGEIGGAIGDETERVSLTGAHAELMRFCAAMDGYSRALGDSPLTLERGERRYLHDLMGVAARRFASARAIWDATAVSSTLDAADVLWADARRRVDEMSVHADAGRFLWADVLGKQIRDHHIVGFEGLFARLGAAVDTAEEVTPESVTGLAPRDAQAWGVAWTRAEGFPARYDAVRAGIRGWCEEHLDSAVLRSLEEAHPLSAELRGWLAAQLAAAVRDGRHENVGLIGSSAHGRHESGGLTGNGGYGRRDVLLEELAAVDPSLAAIAAQHLLAADLLAGATTADDTGDAVREGRLLATVVTQGSINNRPIVTGDAVEGDPSAVAGAGAELHGEAPVVLTALADWLLVVRDNLGYLLPVDDPGVSLQDVGCIGLVGAGVRRAVFDGCVVPAGRVFEIGMLDAGSVLTAPAAGEPFADTLEVAVGDHLAIVRGAGTYLTGRARENASSRVQFPGAFQDEAGRDTIAKFGAVKQMLAEMEAQRILVESLSIIDPCAADTWSGAAVRKLLAADAFGPRPGSISYNCGQVFGGTGLFRGRLHRQVLP